MRIAFVGPFGLQSKRTMAVRALPLARALVARGHQVEVILPPWDSPGDAGKAWDDSGVAIHNVHLPAAVPIWKHYALTASLVRATLNTHPDVVHCFKPKAYAGLTAWALWQLGHLGSSRACLFVDSDDWEGAGGWNSVERYSAAQRRFFGWQERWGLTHHDGLTVASRALETIAWSLGVPRHRVHYVPNGGRIWPAPSADAVLALRRRYGLDGAPVALLYTRFFEFGLDRALAIMADVHGRVPDLHWLVVGRGLFGEQDDLQQRAADLGLGERFHYAGWIEEHELPAHFALANVAIYPFDDTLVNRCKCAVKLIDLLGAGVPVVADRVGQNAEYIEHGRSGLLAVPGDREDFVASVVKLLANPDQAAVIGQAAQERIRSEFGWERWARKVEGAYVAALTKAPVSAGDKR